MKKKVTAPTPRFWGQGIKLSQRVLNNCRPLRCFGVEMPYFNIISTSREGGGDRSLVPAYEVLK